MDEMEKLFSSMFDQTGRSLLEVLSEPDELSKEIPVEKCALNTCQRELSKTLGFSIFVEKESNAVVFFCFACAKIIKLNYNNRFKFIKEY